MNEGHGHVVPRADGFTMWCGGPGFCAGCNQEEMNEAIRISHQAKWTDDAKARIRELEGRVKDLERLLVEADRLIGFPIRKAGWSGLPHITLKAAGPCGEVMTVPERGYVIDHDGNVREEKGASHGG